MAQDQDQTSDTTTPTSSSPSLSPPPPRPLRGVCFGMWPAGEAVARPLSLPPNTKLADPMGQRSAGEKRSSAGVPVELIQDLTDNKPAEEEEEV